MIAIYLFVQLWIYKNNFPDFHVKVIISTNEMENN